MYLIDLIVVGKPKESHWREAQADFMTKIRPFAKVNLIEVSAEPMTPTVREKDSMAAEGAAILRRLPEDTYVVALERTGKPLASTALAELIKREGEAGGRIAFIIGGTAGLDPTVLSRAKKIISLSEMTFTHEMARVFLLEQLYRSMTILAGKKYHY